MASLLQMTDITLTLNHCAVLHDLDFDVAEGEIHALLGTNGSGKSSLALMVMGCRNHVPETGSLNFMNQDIKDWPMQRRASAGISLAWQEPSRFEGLSVGIISTSPETVANRCAGPIKANLIFITIPKNACCGCAGRTDFHWPPGTIGLVAPQIGFVSDG